MTRVNSSPAPRRAGCVLLASLVVLSCVGATGEPAWVSNPYDGLAQETHLAAVGSGADRQSASANAQGALSQIFRAEIDQVIEDRQELTVVEIGRSSRSSVVQNVEVRTSTRTAATLEGVEIDQVWRDDAGTRYARAVLHKGKARTALAAQIQTRDEAVRSHLARASSAQNALDRARFSLQALEPAVERANLKRRYRVVGGKPSGPVDGGSPHQIASDAERALAKVEIAIDAREAALPEPPNGSPVRAQSLGALPLGAHSPGELPLLRRDLAEALTDMGFHVVANGTRRGDDPLNLVVRMGLARVDRGVAGWTFFRWQASYELIEHGAYAQALAVGTSSGEESHTSADVARARALEKGRAVLSRDLARRLSKYLYGDPEC